MKDRFSLIFLVVVFLIFFMWIIWWVGFLNIKEVIVNNQADNCVYNEQVIKALDLFGKNILFIKNQEISVKLLKEFPCLKEVSVGKILPNKVVLNIFNRQPFIKIVKLLPQEQKLDLILQENISSQSALVNWSVPKPLGEVFVSDIDGVIFKKYTDGNMPLLVLSGVDLAVGKALDPKLFGNISLVVQKLIESRFLTNQEILLSDIGLQVYTQPKLIFSLNRDLLKQLASLQLILQKATINEKEMSIIDLRFDKPVVTYVPQNKEKK